MKFKIPLLIFIILLTSCGRKKDEGVFVKSEKIANFSNIDYIEAPGHSYFNEINKLPYGFTLGDFFDHNSILFLTESANIFPFDDENLKYFLTSEELNTALDTYIDSSFTEPITRKAKYYPYGKLITKNYVLLIINKRTRDSKGRDYKFYIRTYTFDGKLISENTLAKWDDENEIYYSGWLMPDMTIKRVFENGKIELLKIKENGEIKFI